MLRIAAFLFGAFAVAYNISVALHEAGHAFATVLDGGRIEEFVLNPFSWSWSLGREISHPVFTAWGGVTFGLAFALLPLVVLVWIRARTPRAALWILGGTALLVNGVYLVAGVVARAGDGGELVRRGVAALPMVALGGIYIIVALVPWTLAQSPLGLGRDVRLSRRLAILLLAIAPYSALMVLYNAVMDTRTLPLWTVLAGSGALFTLLIAAAGQAWTRLRRHQVGDDDDSDSDPVTCAAPALTDIALVNALALGIVVAEFVLFGVRDAPF